MLASMVTALLFVINCSLFLVPIKRGTLRTLKEERFLKRNYRILDHLQPWESPIRSLGSFQLLVTSIYLWSYDWNFLQRLYGSLFAWLIIEQYWLHYPLSCCYLHLHFSLLKPMTFQQRKSTVLAWTVQEPRCGESSLHVKRISLLWNGRALRFHWESQCSFCKSILSLGCTSGSHHPRSEHKYQFWSWHRYKSWPCNQYRTS